MINDAYVKVNLDNIKHNVETLIKNYSYDYYIGVVKGFGYGHGLYVCKAMEEAGINYFAVSSMFEAIELRKITKLPILCLEPIDFEDVYSAIKNDITLTISSIDYFKTLIKSDPRVKVHIKLDTGMTRLGLTTNEELKYVLKHKNKSMYIEGLYSHIASVGFFDDSYDQQIKTFKEITKDIDLKQFKIIHIERSLSLMAHPKLDFANGIRPGIMLYGYNQLPKIDEHNLKTRIKRMINHNYSKTTTTVNYQLKPAFSLHSRIIEIKDLKANQKLGYGNVYQTKENERLAIVAIGYADGLMMNHYKNVHIKNKDYPIVSINMKMISVIVDKDVTINDEVEIFGEHINAQALSKSLGINVYKLLCNIPLSIPRYYYMDNNLKHIERR